MGRATARAGQLPLFWARRSKLQQLGKRRRSRLMHGRTHGHLDGFQSQTARLVPYGENELEEMFYFAGDLLLDDLSRFFFCVVNSCSTGRARQIFSLTSNNCCAS
jgi:hypothetical protein